MGRARPVRGLRTAYAVTLYAVTRYAVNGALARRRRRASAPPAADAWSIATQAGRLWGAG